MNAEDTIMILKEQYDRDTRKQLVKSILEEEKGQSTASQSATLQIINQIFSYVLKNANWNITLNSSDWDTQPLEIMKAVFPKIETTHWYKDKHLSIGKDIDLIVGK